MAITASIGIVEVVPPATAESVLRDADRAMSEAKAAGRNRISIYEGSMHDRMVRRLELETELRDALAQDQFEVHYQPVVHSATNVIIGAEALLRWRHPQRGLLTPDSFLSVSEEMGLMEPLGDWILRRACIQANEWQMIDPARAFSIAVNLSAPEMFSADLIGRVDRALAESGLPGKLLVLEITERIMMADTQQARRQLQELRRLGVRIAIDDFGTGYSSLAYLRDLPIDILKVDRSFVDPLGADHQALALLRAIVGIADAARPRCDRRRGRDSRAGRDPRPAGLPYRARLLLRSPDERPGIGQSSGLAVFGLELIAIASRPATHDRRHPDRTMMSTASGNRRHGEVR